MLIPSASLIVNKGITSAYTFVFLVGPTSLHYAGDDLASHRLRLPRRLHQAGGDPCPLAILRLTVRCRQGAGVGSHAGAEQRSRSKSKEWRRRP